MTVVLICCQNGGSPSGGRGDGTGDQKDEANAGFPRDRLIEELKKLKTAFASKDKNRIAAIFDFPMADSTYSIYIEDSSYDKDKQKSEDRLTAEVFLTYFDKIYRAFGIDELDALFRLLPLDSLLQKDTLDVELHNKNKPCYKYYQLNVAGGLVNIVYGSNTNADFTGKPTNPDECEFAVFWSFRF